MKKFVNRSNAQKTVLFKDGSAQFLQRGQWFQSDLEIESVDEGIKVTEVAEKVNTQPKKQAVKESKE